MNKAGDIDSECCSGRVRAVRWAFAALCVVAIIPGKASSAENLAGGRIGGLLVDDKTWGLVFHGAVHYWNFYRDGSMCVRGARAERDSKCLDKGQWRIEDRMLCWKLEWLNAGGINSTVIWSTKFGFSRARCPVVNSAQVCNTRSDTFSWAYARMQTVAIGRD